MRYIAVLDTNVLWEDFFLQGDKFNDLFGFVSSTGGALVIPQIVVEEMCRHYQKQSLETRSHLKSFLKGLGRMQVRDYGRQIDDIKKGIDTALGDYRRKLENRLAEGGCTVAPWEKLELADVVGGYLQGNPPWDSNGAGLSDWLIWQCVKDYSAHSDIVFISGDGDFGKASYDGTLSIHPHLLRELAEGAVVRAYTSIHAYLQREKPTPESVNPQWLEEHPSYSSVVLEVMQGIADQSESVESIFYDIFGPMEQFTLTNIAVEPRAIYRATMSDPCLQRLEAQFAVRCRAEVTTRPIPGRSLRKTPPYGHLGAELVIMSDVSLRIEGLDIHVQEIQQLSVLENSLRIESTTGHDTIE